MKSLSLNLIKNKYLNIVVYVSLSSPPFWEHMQKHNYYGGSDLSVRHLLLLMDINSLFANSPNAYVNMKRDIILSGRSFSSLYDIIRCVIRTLSRCAEVHNVYNLQIKLA